MQNRRKQRIAAIATAVTLLSAMVLPGGMTALAAENPLPPSACGQQAAAAPSADTPSAGTLSTNTPSADVPAAAEMVNTSFLSADTISRGQSVKVWLFSEKGTGTVRYSVYYKKAASAKWSKMAENTSAAFVKLKPSVATDYVVKVEAKDSSGNTAAAELPLKVTEPLSNTSFLSSESISYGGSLKAYCRSEGGVGETNYAVYYKRSSQTKWIRSKDYSTSCVAMIRPKVAAAYDVKIKARDESGVISEKTMTVWVKSASDLQNRTALSVQKAEPGQDIWVNNASTGGTGEVQFAAYYRPTDSESWTKISTYTADECVKFTPAKTGDYIVRTKVKDSSGRIVNKDIPLTVTEKAPEPPVFEFGEIDDTVDGRRIRSAEDYAAMQQEADPSYTLPAELPDRVDNSDNEYFPAIVNQVGSACCIYATTYYQYTYEYNRLHQIKTNEKNSFSPAYTYNLATDKNAGGMLQSRAYKHLKLGGAVTTALLPFGKTISNNYKTGPFPGSDKDVNYYTYDLPLDEETYRHAAGHRIRNYYEFSLIGDWNTAVTSPDDNDIVPVKTALAEGHVLTVHVYDRWRYKRLTKTDDPAVNSGVAGQNCIYYSFGETGDHIVTIVGYDDHIWTDINGNNAIDPGEMGAFKIANSWGEYWQEGNQGYIWMAYDALNHRSCVQGFQYEAADQQALDENEKSEKPDNKIQRMFGMYHICGIQLMPAEYQSTVFMHYIANTNDRANSYVKLTGEYNGSTVTECMDPFNHTEGEFVPVAYNLSKPDEAAHFVYDVSPIVRKLGAADYTDVRWTVTLECKGAADAFMKLSDIYLCDEKNYRLYRTDGSFPLKLGGSSRQSLALSDTYTRYAKVNYRGYDGQVEMKYYPQGDDDYQELREKLMTPVKMPEGYTHTAIVDLGDCEYYNVYFDDLKNQYDDNGEQDYKIRAGENNFETTEALQPLKITLPEDICTEYWLDEELYFSVSAEGGKGPYRFRYTVRDAGTGRLLFDGDESNQAEKTVRVPYTRYPGRNNVFVFDKTGHYQVTVYASDVTGNTVHVSFTVNVIVGEMG